MHIGARGSTCRTAWAKGVRGRWEVRATPGGGAGGRRARVCGRRTNGRQPPAKGRRPPLDDRERRPAKCAGESEEAAERRSAPTGRGRGGGGGVAGTSAGCGTAPENVGPAVAGRPSKMALTRSRRGEMGHRSRAYERYDSVRRADWLQVHAAPGSRDLLHFVASAACPARPLPRPGLGGPFDADVGARGGPAGRVTPAPPPPRRVPGPWAHTPPSPRPPRRSPTASRSIRRPRSRSGTAP